LDDSDHLPLSWLSQVDYCPRRAALLLNERIWVENVDTAKGRAEHIRVHKARIERRGDSLKLYEYTVFSNTLGVAGKCDCIEASRFEDGCMIKAVDFPVRLYPVEYKHGSVREEHSYFVQLCAQAMCLEEMFSTNIPCGALFFISAHRRKEVEFSAQLRAGVREQAELLKKLWDRHIVPPAEYGPKCKRCSIQEYCMPKINRSAKAYCKNLVEAATKVEMP
jgi:CRISPR-associated exonuclease Cas4